MKEISKSVCVIFF